MSANAQARAPLAIAAVAFAAGVWLASALLRSPSQWGWSAALLALCAIAAVFGKALRTAQVAAILAFICAGAFAGMATPAPSGTVPPSDFVNGDEIQITAHVVSDGDLLAAGGPRSRFDLMTESIQHNGVTFAQPVGIRVTVLPRRPRPRRKILKFYLASRAAVPGFGAAEFARALSNTFMEADSGCGTMQLFLLP